ncbi:MAG: class I SAM-dependent methyltransferase [Methylocella sp.]
MDLGKVKKSIPWWAKIGAKIVLSRLPLRHRFWQRMRLFQLGPMASPHYALGVFRKHFDRVDFSSKEGGFVVLELGPGDSLSTALIARAFGAKACYMVDISPYARTDIAPYLALARYLRECGLDVPNLGSFASVAEMLEKCEARYETEGLKSLRTIPTASVDFIFSQSVLQHIRLGEFVETMAELRRVLSANGVCSHRIDLRDCIGGGLNNLRFSAALWESDFIASSGFYTNRIRFVEMLNLFADAGFRAECVAIERWRKYQFPEGSWRDSTSRVMTTNSPCSDSM